MKDMALLHLVSLKVVTLAVVVALSGVHGHAVLRQRVTGHRGQFHEVDRFEGA